MSNILWFDEVGMADLPQVGGKNASLGEMVSHLSDLGVRVPGGFATTADAYRSFLSTSGLDQRIREAVEAIDVDDVTQLSRVGAAVREWIEQQPLPADIETDIRTAYTRLGARVRIGWRGARR
ncbi:PEP/pyruvate-binding domain-containing protein [Microbacterium profundi]|uniref:Phosphoenolpyruvate synthase n=1 Tax=Microbacterium profundi TaxID=450380 RepID=A0ABV3LDA8_9MICO